MNKLRVLRGRINDAVANEDSIVRCSVLGLDDEQIDEVEIFGTFGVAAAPPDGAECIAVQFGHRTVVIAVADRSITPGGSQGDIVVHNSKDQYITIKAAGGVEIKTSGAVTVDAPSINLGGDTGLRKLLDERFVNSFNAHTHPAPGGTTSTPAPVALLAVSTSVVEGK